MRECHPLAAAAFGGLLSQLMNDFDDATLVDAIGVWTGWGDRPFPDRNDARIIAKYGAELGPRLVAAARSLMGDFYSSTARHTAPGLVEMGDQAAAEFRAAHPDIPERVVEALYWCYTFDNR